MPESLVSGSSLMLLVTPVFSYYENSKMSAAVQGCYARFLLYKNNYGHGEYHFTNLKRWQMSVPLYHCV